MSTSGTYISDMTLADVADEAFERAGVAVTAITGEHIASFRRSMGLALQSTLANLGPRQWKFSTLEHVVSANENYFTLPAGAIDVTTMTLRRSDKETEMNPISRSDYRLIHDKAMTGRPSRYFLDRLRDDSSSTRPVVRYWQAAENNTDVIVAEYYSYVEDVGTSGAGTLDLPKKFRDAVCAELAKRMAEKFKPERYDKLKGEAEQAIRLARMGDTEMADLTVTIDLSGR